MDERDYKAMNEELNQPSCLGAVISRFSQLPRKGLLADFSGIGLNQLVEFHTYDFHDLIIFDMQLEHIKERAKELNANFVVYHMGSSDLLKSDTYLMKFTQNGL
jgi:hypothetical protein